jgi:transcriptional regulator with XRE-family HTH domain
MEISNLEKNIRMKSPTLETIELIAEALEICVYSLIEFNCEEKCKYFEYCIKREFFNREYD